jgi:hypothetical protein
MAEGAAAAVRERAAMATAAAAARMDGIGRMAADIAAAPPAFAGRLHERAMRLATAAHSATLDAALARAAPPAAAAAAPPPPPGAAPPLPEMPPAGEAASSSYGAPPPPPGAAPPIPDLPVAPGAASSSSAAAPAGVPNPASPTTVFNGAVREARANLERTMVPAAAPREMHPAMRMMYEVELRNLNDRLTLLRRGTWLGTPVETRHAIDEVRQEIEHTMNTVRRSTGRHAEFDKHSAKLRFGAPLIPPGASHRGPGFGT